jgi:parallel beta-helix repeat protein
MLNGPDCSVTGNIVENCTYGLYIDDSVNDNLSGNALALNTYNLYIYGEESSHFVHNIEATNTVNGKPVIYLVGENGIVINQDNVIGYLGLVQCNNVLVENLILENNGQGILLANVENGKIENIVCRNNEEGIELFQCENVNLENNTIENSYEYGIVLSYSDNCAARNNQLRESCIFLMYSENCTISSNVVENYPEAAAIAFDESDNNTVENNTVGGAKTGVSLYRSHGNTFENNLIENCSDHGIYLYQSDNNKIENNTVRNIYGANGAGIQQSGSLRSTISGNTVDNCAYGIYIYSNAGNTVVSGNTAENNSYGICLDAAENVVVSGNTVKNNTYGIYMTSWQTPNKTIYHNLIYNNTTNAHNALWATWDNGSEGNWWGDWQWENAVDENNDGIFENERLITGGGPYQNAYDYHPLSLVNLKTPDNGASVGSPVTLQWTAPALPVYVVQVDNNSDFGSIEYENTINVSIDSFDLSRTVGTQAMLGSGTWYWRVRVKDSEGVEVCVSPVRYFIIS